MNTCICLDGDFGRALAREVTEECAGTGGSEGKEGHRLAEEEHGSQNKGPLRTPRSSRDLAIETSSHSGAWH